ncbi:2OG-Fe(II) oxygenase [Portibacter lacus]|uniref:Proline hydroxylase n=1 Tax=Portibacter lacus TaxID=1099794 RepID=A0AA37WEB8_9BACT|nr:2OG-Fe(II) oxygenase [Portibacter lacus]GLR16529.1 proline hydroxylase [Portibacter lacus]
MEQIFESIINSYLETKVGQSDQFLNDDLSKQLREIILLLFQENQLKAAGIGNNAKFLENKLIRSDFIYWLDRNHNNVYENDFFDIMDEFVKYLNRTCYSGITGYEFHFAYYDKGSFYKRHLDQFRDNQNRAFSMIMYLNENWMASDGGELCIYHENSSQIISPLNGRCVFFKSNELEHEVLLSYNPRMSVTGWFKTN